MSKVLTNRKYRCAGFFNGKNLGSIVISPRSTPQARKEIEDARRKAKALTRQSQNRIGRLVKYILLEDGIWWANYNNKGIFQCGGWGNSDKNSNFKTYTDLEDFKYNYPQVINDFNIKMLVRLKNKDFDSCRVIK